ncbi:hypothetical protein BDD12DRAFT_875760 [Trichophaea hybrida]|nr:hypothetical protein BDD12DRAFT_875760 [Trichophaea hybrida]
MSSAPSDLQLARSASTLDPEVFSSLLRTPRERAARAKLLPIISTDPLFAMTSRSRPFNNHAQNLLHALALCKRLLTLRDIHNWTREEFLEAVYLQNDMIPFQLHEGAFTVVIEAQGTDAQRDYWIPKCHSYEVVGCYAQTELAHGSNVQGLETVAHYDPTTKEFEIYSPRIESTKWWVGGMGICANHALVQAILEVPSGRKGPHLFMIPLRSPTTHLPLPGIKVGDIGPKAYGGFCFMDNGYLHLSSVRIPLENMLQRHAQVTPDGTYIPAKHDKLSYGSMVYLRAGIPSSMGWCLARAVTIAIRYCTNRRQFAHPGQEEQQVINYASTKMRLYPLLARAYAYIFAGRELRSIYYRMLDALTNRGDVTLLPEVHVLSSALKVKSSWDCTPGSEEARKSMGGHGYSHLAGVDTIFAAQAPAQTYEGDNYVISQQVARALVKSVLLLKQRPDAKLPESFSYIRLAVDGKRIARNNHLHFLHARAVSILITLAEAVVANPQMSWTDHSWASARLAAAHADVFVVSKLPETPLSSLHTLSTLVAALPELLEAGVIMTPQAVKALRKAQEDAVDALSLGDVIRLTDAFEFHDWELPGVVGASDGRVYERMLEMALEWDVSLGKHGEELRRRALEISNHSKQGKSAKL